MRSIAKRASVVGARRFKVMKGAMVVGGRERLRGMSTCEYGRSTLHVTGLIKAPNVSPNVEDSGTAKSSS